MRVKQVIESLTRAIEMGQYTEDDDLYITWWSYEDVTLMDEEVDNDKARAVWAEVYDTIECWDEVDNYIVQSEIRLVLDKQEEDSVANTLEVLGEVLKEMEEESNG